MSKKVITLIAAFIAAAVACFMLYAGFAHNAMGEFCTNSGELDCNIDWYYAISLWVCWLIPVFGITFIILLGCKAVNTQK